MIFPVVKSHDVILYDHHNRRLTVQIKSLNHNPGFEKRLQLYFLFGSNKEEWSARFPRTNDNPPRSMDFPAPVSPVIQVIPEENEATSSSIKAKFFIVS